MPALPPDILQKFQQIQPQIWQTVSLTLSEASGHALSLLEPKVQNTSAVEAGMQLSAHALIIQFAFAAAPESAHIIVVSMEAALELASLAAETPVRELDENIVSDLRPVMEGLVQGLCLSIGSLRNESMVASGLSIRHQILSMPPTLQKAGDITRIDVELHSEDASCPVSWLMDSDAVHLILGLESHEEEAAPFAQSIEFGAAAAGVRSHAMTEDPHGIELLMDIPLEISVELGRVKMLVRDVVDLSTGSIVEIDKAAGEPVDVMVNGRIVARGEVVVIEDNFGVRITEILNPHDRLVRLGEVA